MVACVEKCRFKNFGCTIDHCYGESALNLQPWMDVHNVLVSEKIDQLLSDQEDFLNRSHNFTEYFFLIWDMKILTFASEETFCIIVTGQHIHSVQYYEASQFHFFTLQVVLCLPWKKAESIIATVTIVEDMVNLHYFRVLPWSNIRNAAMNNMNKKYENISPFSSFPY